MLRIQNDYITYLQFVQTELAGLHIENNEIPGLMATIADTELIAPVVGAFSAGKSTLINSLLGRNYLPVGLPPETAVAAELRYSERDFIEAVKDDDTREEYGIDEMDQINKKAGEYKYLSIHLDNGSVKSMAPVVLVDMPGFDSPLDIHNRAIVNYLNRGVYYIVLAGVEDGILTRSMVRHLSNILELGRDFSLFVSKANLRAASEVDEVVAKIKEQIKETFGLSKDVDPVGKDGGADLEKIIKQLDPETLFKSLFVTGLKDNFHSIIDDLNIKISALQKDNHENKEAIAKLQDKMDAIIRKRDEMLEDAREKYSYANVNKIVDSVGRELSDCVDELANAALSGGREALSQAMGELIRSSLISHIQISVGEIGSSIIEDFSYELKSIESTMSSFSINNDWLEKLTENSRDMLQRAVGGIGKFVDSTKGGKKSVLYKSIASILAITTNVLSPVLEIIILFLPELLTGFMAGIQKKKQMEQIRNNLMTTVIPMIKRKLRASLPDIFDQQVNLLITQIGDRFNEVLNEQKRSIADMEAEKQMHMDNIQEKIDAYRVAVEKISSKAAKTLY